VKDIMAHRRGVPGAGRGADHGPGGDLRHDQGKAARWRWWTRNGAMTGIFTDGDFRRSALTGGSDFLQLPVSRFMTAIRGAYRPRFWPWKR